MKEPFTVPAFQTTLCFYDIMDALSLDEDQIQLFLEVLSKLGLLNVSEAKPVITTAQDTERNNSVHLPNHPGLSFYTSYRVALSDTLYSAPPVSQCSCSCMLSQHC